MLIFSKYLFHPNFTALAVWPFIFLKHKDLKNDKLLLNHEKIHLKQQIEMLWLLFFVWYFVEFAVKLIIYKKLMTTYRNLSFEREAYENELNLNYISKRKFWNFLKYI